MAIPKGFHTITPYFVVRGAADAITLYQKAFGAEVGHRDVRDDGRIRHAQIKIGDSHIMMTDGSPEYAMMKPIQEFGGSPMQIFLYVEDADGLFKRCLDTGMSEVLPMADQPYGRSGGVRDPFGLIWWLTTAPPEA